MTYTKWWLNVEIPRGYRKLKAGTIIRKGDLMYSEKAFHPVGSFWWGTLVEPLLTHKAVYIRLKRSYCRNFRKRDKARKATADQRKRSAEFGAVYRYKIKGGMSTAEALEAAERAAKVLDMAKAKRDLRTAQEREVINQVRARRGMGPIE